MSENDNTRIYRLAVKLQNSPNLGLGEIEKLIKSLIQANKKKRTLPSVTSDQLTCPYCGNVESLEGDSTYPADGKYNCSNCDSDFSFEIITTEKFTTTQYEPNID